MEAYGYDGNGIAKGVRVERSHRRALMSATIREHSANRSLYYRVTSGF